MNFNQRSIRWFFLAFTLSLFFVWGGGLAYDFIGTTFAVLCLQSLFCIAFVGPIRVSLVRIYFVFSFVFLSLVPWIQYSGDVVLWGGAKFFDEDYVLANILIFLANVVVVFIYCWVGSRGRRYPAPLVASLPRSSKISLLEGWVLIFLSGSSFFGLLALNNFSLVQLFFRGLVDEQYTHSIESSALMLLFMIIARLVPFFCFLYAYTNGRSSRLLKTLLFLLLLVCVFPTGVARYMVGFVYIPVLLVVWPRLRDGLIFASALVLSIFLVFPFLNQFRYFDGVESLRILPNQDFFFEGHFDAYQNFVRAMQIQFVTYGEQLLGSLLFFVPRVFWPEKPVGSGYEMSVRLGYDFSNISMPLLGEGYVNFGVFGVFLFAGAAAALMAKLDRRFSGVTVYNSVVSYSDAVYFYLCGAAFFVLRGDMLSSTAYVAAGLSSAYLVRVAAEFTSRRLRWKRY